ncbi:MAG: hypothetical protein KDB69_00470 [Acidimicrobiia bacterium]|nr:hypothetical protein [Acidimicrobiia bacterium]
MAQARSTRSIALLAVVILLVSLQLFLLVVTAEAFLTHDTGLAWASTAISGGLAVVAVVFYRVLRPRG